jgi:hypothetical protein
LDGSAGFGIDHRGGGGAVVTGGSALPAGGASGEGEIPGSGGTEAGTVGGESGASGGRSGDAGVVEPVASCASEPDLEQITATCSSISDGCLLEFNDPVSLAVETCTSSCFRQKGASDGCAACAGMAASRAHETCKLSQCKGNLAGCEACMVQEQAVEQLTCNQRDPGPGAVVYTAKNGPCGSVEDQEKIGARIEGILRGCSGNICMNDHIAEIMAPGSSALGSCVSRCFFDHTGVSPACSDCFASIAVESAPACRWCSSSPVQIDYTVCYDCTIQQEMARQARCFGN